MKINYEKYIGIFLMLPAIETGINGGLTDPQEHVVTSVILGLMFIFGLTLFIQSQ